MTKKKKRIIHSPQFKAETLLYTHRFDAFALISSDSDFTSLATRLRESEMHVIRVGKAITPTAFKNACDDFVAI
ncbi:NYN domain-containing protein [Vibrio cholerae]|uniref:NYN domain-containing protein n=1 Tax=Vibrio cholerae TaxID=666 RepID=UPI00292A41D5|nr:NYN domain-containing protein [Vibrio cholerae]